VPGTTAALVAAVASALALRLAHVLAAFKLRWEHAMHVRVYFQAEGLGLGLGLGQAALPSGGGITAAGAAVGEQLQAALADALARQHGASPLPAITLLPAGVAHEWSTLGAAADGAAESPAPRLAAAAALTAFDLARVRSEAAVRSQYAAPE
jgi:hypothetical protein